VPYSQTSLPFLTQVFGIFSYEICTVLWSIEIFFTFVCQDWLTLADIKQQYQSKIIKCFIFLSKICKNLEFALSEHWEWGTRTAWKCSPLQMLSMDNLTARSLSQVSVFATNKAEGQKLSQMETT
jgi:hypothetical protein